MWTYNYNDAYFVGNELYHHGVPGMRWGIRKVRDAIGGKVRGSRTLGQIARKTGYYTPSAAKRSFVKRFTSPYSRTGAAINIGKDMASFIKRKTYEKKMSYLKSNPTGIRMRSTGQKIVHKYLNSMGSRKLNDYGKLTRITGMNTVLSSGKNLGYSIAYDSIRFASKKNPRFKRLR